MKESVTLAFLGDVMLGRGVNEEIPYHPPESFWGNVLPLLRQADAVIANLECAITQHTQECRRTKKVFHFRADPAAVDLLETANIQCVSLANNHTLDFDEQGLLDTLHYLDMAGIHHAGAGQNLREAAMPLIMDIAGFRVGFIALTDNEPSFAASPNRPGTHYLEIRSDPNTLAFLEESIEQLRRDGAMLVILSAHWGPNMVTSPPPWFRNFAHAAIDCGVDLFYGHSAHLFQGVEVYNHGLILYDPGDFLDDYAVDPILRNDWSFLFLVDVNAQGLHRLRMVPVRLNYGRVDLACGGEFAAIRHRMRSLCAAFNTHTLQISQGLEVLVRQNQLLHPV
ncbi:MAG TPA: CapA family protein [Cyanophyceae cyanobacterium]